MHFFIVVDVYVIFVLDLVTDNVGLEKKRGQRKKGVRLLCDASVVRLSWLRVVTVAASVYDPRDRWLCCAAQPVPEPAWSSRRKPWTVSTPWATSSCNCEPMHLP